jgi:DNA modification methylase
MEDHLKIMPVSVIDIGKQEKRIIEKDHHAKKSSRSGFSPFPDEINTLCFEFFLKNCNKIFDPFAGWGERASKAKEYGKDYYGVDISEEAIRVAKESFDVTNHLGDSKTCDIPEFDGVITCPPYFNLEKYASENGIDRIKKWEDFLESYRFILERIIKEAKEGTTFCIMVGNWRSKGVYYDLQFETDKIFKDNNLTTIDKIVVSRKKVSKIKIMLPQCKRLGYSVNVHEHLLIYRK